MPAGEPGRLSQVAAAAVAAYRDSMDRFALQDGMAAAYALIDAANSFITETEPWKLAKDEANAPRVAQILYEVAEALRIAAILLLPAMPASAAEILRRVGAPKSGTDHRLDDAVLGRGRRPGDDQGRRHVAAHRGSEEEVVSEAVASREDRSQKPEARSQKTDSEGSRLRHARCVGNRGAARAAPVRLGAHPGAAARSADDVLGAGAGDRDLGSTHS